MSSPTFRDLFDDAPAVEGRAPGRVNLIGEHTDYNGGFVLPAAIPLETRVELAPRPGSRVRVWSAQFPGIPPLVFDIGSETRTGEWTDYVKGMTWSLTAAGPVGGFDARFDSRVPVGSGLSSSAALEIAVGRALREAFDLPLDDVALAVAARRAETDFVGAPVGIMDQMACSLARTDSALWIDTRTLAHAVVAIPPGAALLVIDSTVTHKHAGGEYTTRRDECARAAAALGVFELRDVTVADLGRIARLPAPLDRRARHVVTENARVQETVTALKARDLAAVGRLFAQSHASMRDDFEVSIPAIDALVACAEGVDGVYGARLTGGGFGGSIVALVDRGRVREAGAAIVRAIPSARVVVPA